MKLLFVIKSLASAVGGAERVLCTICSELAGRGHDVTILTFDRPGQKPFYPLSSRVRRLDLGIGNTRAPAKPFETLKRMQALRKVIRTEGPEIAVGFMHSMYVPLALACIGLPTAVIGSEHIVPTHYRWRPLQYGLLIVSTLFMARMTVLSARIQASYPLLVRRKMAVLTNPVVLAPTAANIGLEKPKFVLLCVGRLDAQKDHTTLLHAFALIAPAFPQWHLQIVGEGPLRAELEQLIDQLNLKTRVSMPGITKNIGEAYQAAELFVISSRYEAFGLVTAEAMSHGLPVIGFADCPGTNELIASGQTGILVSPEKNRSQALANALCQLMKDPALRRHLGSAARLTIGAQFSSKLACDQWEALMMGLHNEVAA